MPTDESGDGGGDGRGGGGRSGAGSSSSNSSNSNSSNSSNSSGSTSTARRIRKRMKGATGKLVAQDAAVRSEALAGASSTLLGIWTKIIKITPGLTDAIDKMKRSLRPVGKAIGKSVVPIFQAVAEVVETVSDAFLSLPGPVKAAIGAAFLLVTALTVGIGIAMTFATAISVVASTLGVLLAPILLVIGALALLFAAWKADIGGMREIVSNVVATVKKLIADFVAFVRPRVMAFLGKLSTLWRTHFSEILSETKETVNTLMPVFQAAMAYLQTVTKVVWNVISTVILQRIDEILSFVRAAMAVLRGDFGEAFQIIAGLFQRTVDRFAGLAGALFAILGDILTVFMGFAMSLSALLAKLNARVVNRFRLMMEVAIARVKTGLNQMVGFWESAANSIIGVVNDLGETIARNLNSMIEEVNSLLPDSMQFDPIEFEGFGDISIEDPFEVRSRQEIEAAAEGRLQDRLDAIDRAKQEQMKSISKAIDSFFGTSGPESGGSDGSGSSGGSGGSGGSGDGFGGMFGRSGGSDGPGSQFINTGGSGSSSGSDGPLSGLGDSSSGSGSSLPGMGSSSSRTCCCPTETRGSKTGTGKSLPGLGDSSTGTSSPSNAIVDPSNVVSGPFSPPRPNASGGDSSSGPNPGAVEPPTPPIISDLSGGTEVNIERMEVNSDAPAPNTRHDSRNLSEDIASEFGSQLDNVR